MPAPLITALPSPPTRANPGNFTPRADAFLSSLPAFVTQVNALVQYWNAELDTSAFLTRAGGTVTGTVVFNLPPTMFASGTAGEQTALRLGKGTVTRQAVNIRDDGGLNISPLNNAAAALYVGGSRVYTTSNRPTLAELGALAASAYTAEDVLAKLQSVSGGSGSTIDAATLANQPGSYYRNASNLNSGTVPDARLPSSLVRNNISMSAGDGLSGGGSLAASRSFAVDSSVARRDRANIFNQTQRIENGDLDIRQGNSSTVHLWMRGINGITRGLIFAGANSDQFNFRAYNTDGSTYREITLSGATGIMQVPAIQSEGSRLTNLNASALDRGTIPSARLPSDVVRSNISLGAGDGLSGGGSLGANRSFAVDASVVRTTRQILAGNGLVGGGALSANRALALGTPGSITPDSTNSVTGESHTHALTRETVGELTSRLAAGAVGTYEFLAHADASVSIGSIYPGSVLRRAGFVASAGNTQLQRSGPGLSGTWMAQGTATRSATNEITATVFKKVT